MAASEATAGRPTLIHKRSYSSILDTIGNTRMVRLNKVIPSGGATVFLKLEFDNPLSSVKDRIGLAMIEAGEAAGKIGKGTRIIEPTSGNTGIALAFICAAKGYGLTLTMPDSMSIERRVMLRHLGAELVLTPAAGGMKGAIDKAAELASVGGDVFMPQQFENPANPKIHEETTGPEIWEDSGHDIDVLVSGVGTGGTLTGVTRYIRSQNGEFKAIAVEPADSAILSGGKPGPHKIQGIGGGFIPKNLDTALVDEVVTVTNEEAFQWGRRLAREEGILAGISTGANVCAAAKVAARAEYKGKRIVTIGCSFGERYLSTPLFEGERDE